MEGLRVCDWQFGWWESVIGRSAVDSRLWLADVCCRRRHSPSSCLWSRACSVQVVWGTCHSDLLQLRSAHAAGLSSIIVSRQATDVIIDSLSVISCIRVGLFLASYSWPMLRAGFVFLNRLLELNRLSQVTLAVSHNSCGSSVRRYFSLLTHLSLSSFALILLDYAEPVYAECRHFWQTVWNNFSQNELKDKADLNILRPSLLLCQ